jgi:hypothetical protein
MFSDPIASLMATESTRRALTAADSVRRAPAAPAREAQPRRSRRAVALVLQRAAHRLDPYVAASR